MAIQTKSGTIKSVTATSSGKAFVLEVDVTNPSPPPPTVKDDFSFTLPSWADSLVCPNVGKPCDVQYDDGSPTVPQSVTVWAS